MEFIFNHIDKIQIRFNDIDLLGHVNNAVIGEYFDIGRMNYLHRIFGGSVKLEQESLVIASVKTDFYIPILLRYDIEVRTKIHELGGKSLKMVQYIVDSNGVKLVESHSVMVAFSVDTKSTIHIPEQWREWIRKIDEDCIDTRK